MTDGSAKEMERCDAGPVREYLETWSRQPELAAAAAVARHLDFVYSSALRRTGDGMPAAEATHAVFLVLARRARKLRKHTVLAGWLFDVTAVACRKIERVGRLRRLWHWISCKPRHESLPDALLWTRVAPEIDRALDRISSRQRCAVLLCAFLNHDFASAAKVLRTRERHVEKRVGRGMKKISKRLQKRAAPVDPGALAAVCATEGCAAPVPEGLALDILQNLEASRGKRPSHKLARRTLNALAWSRWRRRFVIGVPTVGALLVIIGGIAWHLDSLSGHSRLISAYLVWTVRFAARKIAEPARPWPTTHAARRLDARAVHSAQDLYRTTNMWLAHLNFTREQWRALDPKRIEPLPNFLKSDGLIFLRNPKATRSGLAGVLGYEFEWTHAEFEFGGVGFTNVAVRAKGNFGSLLGDKRSFKVDLNRFTKGQKLGGLDKLTFNNLMWDYSCLCDALGYEFFRDIGVAAPRTAYAWLSASVARQWDRMPLGLYLLLEPVDEAFAAERFGSKQTPVFKPVTYTLFEDLGDDWSAYAAIYDLKTKATPEQKRRVIDFARLVSSATDAEFAARVGDFLDLDVFARFLAGEVLLSNYDSILTTGQNFYLYLDARSNKFGFIPWDLDSAWGNFWIGTKPELERASIWHPWVGENRFLARVMAVEPFRRIYRAHLEDCLTRLFVPDRLQQHIDEVAAVLRGPIDAESGFRLNKFEQEVGAKPVKPSPGETPDGVNHPAYPLKRFIEARAGSVRQQLDGKSKGMIVKPPAEK